MKVLFGFGFGMLNYLFLKQLPKPENWVKFEMLGHYWRVLMREILYTEKSWMEWDQDETKRKIFKLKKL